MKKIITAIMISVFLATLVMFSPVFPLASSPVLPLESDPLVIISALGTTVSKLGTETPNPIEDNEVEETEIEDTEVEDNEVEETEVEETEVEETEVEETEIEETEVLDIEEIGPEEPIGIEEMLANAFNCSKDIIFTADSSYGLISEEFMMEFIEKNDKNEEPRMPEIHDCDNFAMEFLMEIDAECALYKIVPAVGVIWVKPCDAEDDDGHAINFWIDPADKSVWTFDPQTDEEYSIEGQIVTFVYM